MVVLSSSGETPDVIKCYKHGVNAYVVKPVDFAEFMKVISSPAFFGRPLMNRRRRPGGKKLRGKAMEPFARKRRKLPMKSPLHILHLEDNPNDAALVQSTLEAGGIPCAITRVQNCGDFVAALKGAALT